MSPCRCCLLTHRRCEGRDDGLNIPRNAHCHGLAQPSKNHGGPPNDDGDGDDGGKTTKDYMQEHACRRQGHTSKQASKHGDNDSLTCVRGLIWECPCPWSPSPSPFSTSTTIIVIVVVVATASATAGGEEHPTVGGIMRKHTNSHTHTLHEQTATRTRTRTVT